MSYLRFLDGSLDPATALPGTYDPFLVVLSYLIAALAAYAALDFAGRISISKSAIAKRSWLTGGALAMGIGVWAMHFIGMLAFRLPIPVAYDPVVTALSIVPAVLAGAVTVQVMSRTVVTIPAIVTSGVLMGAGIGIMHYTGMAAMRMAAGIWYDPYLFLLSVVVAVLLAICALYIKYWASGRTEESNRKRILLGSAAIMGLAITGMHYTAMQSTFCFAIRGAASVDAGLDPTLLGILVAVIAGLIVALSLVGVAVDRRLEAARKHAEDLERVVAERTSQLAEANVQITALNEQLQADNLRMGAELDVTRRLQEMILPGTDELRQIEGLDIACHMQAADEVGGDYYDVLQHNGQVKIGIGDVTGHGLESGVVMVMTQAIVRALLTNGETDPVRFLTTVNHVLRGNMQRMGSDKNLTLCLLDFVDGEVKVSGQHEEMIVVRNGGTVEMVDTNDLGFPIGLDAEIADFINQKTVRLQPGDGVVLYTDGITEADNIADEQYGLERLCDVVREHWKHSAEVIKDAVVSDVKRYIGEQIRYDDITLVVAKQK